MDSIKQLGAALAQHYEKVILSVILLALLGTAAFLPFRVGQSRETIRQALERIRTGKKKDPQPVDTAAMEQSLRRLRVEPKIELSVEHNLFNPVVWKKGNDGILYKVVRGDEDGPGGLQVTAIRPLQFVVQFDGVQRSGDSLRYRFMVLDETKGGRSAHSRPVYLSEGSSSKSDPFTIAKIHGPTEDPTSIEIRFPDSTTAIVSREVAYKQVAGYEADLTHDKLGSRFSNIRTRQPGGLRLGVQSYKIVAITKDAVTVESSTGKRWTIRLKGAP
jgi:hypothetical protein